MTQTLIIICTLLCHSLIQQDGNSTAFSQSWEYFHWWVSYEFLVGEEKQIGYSAQTASPFDNGPGTDKDCLKSLQKRL